MLWSTNSASFMLNCFSSSDDDDHEPDHSNVSQCIALVQQKVLASENDPPPNLDGARSIHGCSSVLFQEGAFANMDVDDIFDEDDDDIV